MGVGFTRHYIEGENDHFFEAVTPVMRRNELTINLRNHFVRWNFDYISLNSNSEGIEDG
jgi:hypothetical protein